MQPRSSVHKRRPPRFVAALVVDDRRPALQFRLAVAHSVAAAARSTGLASRSARGIDSPPLVTARTGAPIRGSTHGHGTTR